jgi:hypothetical protein
MTDTSRAIDELTSRLIGLANDAHYWDLRRTYGDHSLEVSAHLVHCAESQGVEIPPCLSSGGDEWDWA